MANSEIILRITESSYGDILSALSQAPDDGTHEIVIRERKTGTRTNPQNNSIHLFCGNLATEMNKAGITKRAMMEIRTIDVPWTKDSVKEDLWCSIQAALYPDTVGDDGHVYTSKLDKLHVSYVHEKLMTKIHGHWNLWVEFPHRDGL